MHVCRHTGGWRYGRGVCMHARSRQGIMWVGRWVCACIHPRVHAFLFLQPSKMLKISIVALTVQSLETPGTEHRKRLRGVRTFGAGKQICIGIETCEIMGHSHQLLPLLCFASIKKFCSSITVLVHQKHSFPVYLACLYPVEYCLFPLQDADECHPNQVYKAPGKHILLNCCN